MQKITFYVTETDMEEFRYYPASYTHLTLPTT